MPSATVTPAANAKYSIDDFIGALDWLVSDANQIGGMSSTSFRLSGTGSAVTAVVNGSGFTYQSGVGAVSGVATSVTISLNGVVQGTIACNVNLATLRPIIDADESGQPLALENYFQGFDWTYNGTNAVDNAPAGVLVGDGALFNLRGNDTLRMGGGNDIIFAGDGNDTIDGGAGVDRMDGGKGNDRFFVDNAQDVVLEAVNEGSDTVLAHVSYVLKAGVSVEVLRAATPAATTALNLTGNAFAQTIIGNAGKNLINGGAGNDVLTGGAGMDTFRFSTALAATNVDRVTDFKAVDDTIQLDDAVFGALSVGRLTATEFKDIATGAKDADDHIIYDSRNGALYYDPDGSGAGAMVRFATLVGAPAITAADFVVI